MGLVLRVPHVNMPAGSTVSATKLTLSQMDNNFIFLQNLIGGITPLTVSDAIDLANNSQVITGQTYLIKNAHSGLYGSQSNFTYGLEGTDIILTGLDNSNFSPNGYGKFYNPNYASYSMWNPNGEYSIGNEAIFGGQVWVNTTGNTGYTLENGYDTSSYISLDPTDWSVQSYTNSSYYNCVWDEVKYDLKNDFITSRYEAFSNNYVNNGSRTFWFYCEINPIQSFKWGVFIDYPRITNCSIIDSYFGCLNADGDIYDVELKNFSWIFNITLINNSYLSRLKLSNNSGINQFILDGGCYLSDITIDNNSSMYNFQLVSNSYIEQIELINNCTFYGFYFEASYASYISLKKESSMYNLGFYSSSYTQWIDLSGSTINNSYLYNNSRFEEIEMVNDSEMSNIILHDYSYMDCVYISNDSSVSNINIYVHSYFEGIIVKNNSSINGVLLCDDSGESSFISYIEINNNSHLWDDDDSIYLNDSGYMTGIKIDNHSAITNIVMYGYSNIYQNIPYMSDISISNGSLIDSVTINARANNLSPSFLKNLNIINGGFSNIELLNSYMEYLNISNGGIDNLYLSVLSYITDIEIHDGAISYFNMITESGDSIYLENSRIQGITIEQSVMSGYISLLNSYIQNIHLSNYSTLVGGYRNSGNSTSDTEYNYSIILDSSNLDTITLANRSLFGLGYINLINGSSIRNFTLNNSSNLSGYINLNDSSINNFILNNSSKFGRSYQDTNNYDNGSIQLFGSTMEYFNMTNNAIVDGVIYLDNSYIKDVTLSGIANSEDNPSPSQDSIIYYFNNTTGIIFGNGMELYDSYLQDIEVSNGSYFTGLHNNRIYLENSSYMQCIKLDNGSIFNCVHLSSSYMKNIEVLNGSYIYNVALDSNSSITYLSVSNYSFFGDYIYLSNSSYMTFIKIDNNSELFGGDYGDYDIYLYDHSYMENINILNYSSMTGFTFDDGGSGGSYFKTITLNNNSVINNIELYNGSYLTYIEVLNSSGINSIHLCNDTGSNSYLYNIKLNNNSYITDDEGQFYIEDSSSMESIDMNNNCTISGYIEMYNGSRISNIKLENGSSLGYNINLEAAQIINISIVNNSYINGYLLLINSSFDYINLMNNSWITDHSEFYGSYLYNIELLNYSKIYNTSMVDSAIGQLAMTNNCKMYNNNMVNYSAIEYTTLTNHTNIYENDMDNSTLEYLSLNDNSNLNNNILNSSNFKWLNINDSSINNNSLYENSGFYDCSLSDSSVYNIGMTSSSNLSDTNIYGSTVENISMYSSAMIGNHIKNSNVYLIGMTQSNLNNLELYDSSIHTSSILDSGIYSCNLKASEMANLNLSRGIEFVYMRDANLRNYNTIDSIVNLDMLGTTLDFDNNDSYVVPYYTNANTNSIKYQFSFVFNGTTGYGESGAVNIPFVMIPSSGWYIERVVLDNNGTGQALVASGAGVYLNIGNNVDSDTGLSNTKGDVSLLASKITYSDISNGGADGTKTNTIGNLTMNIEGGNITAGIILVEVILKNTNYGTNND